MAYSIVDSNAVAFADSKNIKFPRFQRKATWKEVDNFKLCISVFKGYPIGVVIVNTQGDTDFLLDGRQRRNALKTMKDNPREVYDWARKFVGFKANDSVEDVSDKFWASIDEYLQHDASKIKNKNKTDEEEEEATDYSELIVDKDNAYDFESQYKSLKSLLDLILLCHPLKGGVTNLEKMYKMNNIIPLSELEYVDAVNGEYKINPFKLKKYIDYLNSESIDNPDSFSYSLIKRYKVEPNKQDKVKNYINQQWDYFKRSLIVIEKINNVLSRSKIGMIALTNADILDAQNIFSLVNASGTPLSAEELLSARPFWNIKLNNPSAELLEHRKDMYKFLGIELPEETCRWDLCATFLKRIDKEHIIFEKDKNTFTTDISLSYRIISGIFVGGINNTSVTSLEKANIDWEIDIERLIRDINFVVSLLSDINYFKLLRSWNQSIMSLTSNSIAIEFCALMYKTWIEMGKPQKTSANISSFNRKAVYLFDRLVYEYSNRLWSGSGDSSVAAHLKNSESRFVKVTEDEWKKFIEEIGDGNFKGKPTTSKTLKPFIYNYYLLKGMKPTIKDDCTYEIDHIVAQQLFNDNPEVNQSLKDTYFNFALLPKGENIEKTNKRLNKISDPWLIEQIKKYSDLDDEMIETLSNLDKITELMAREHNFLEAYTTKRNEVLANIN